MEFQQVFHTFAFKRMNALRKKIRFQVFFKLLFLGTCSLKDNDCMD